MTATRRCLVLVTALCLVPACATMQGYPGTKRPPEEIATVADTFGYYIFAMRSVNLTFLDGQYVGGMYGGVHVLPGTHTVGFTYYLNILNSMTIGRDPCFVTFEAETGHRYRVDGESTFGGTWHGWLEDEETGVRIPGTFYNPAR